MTDRRTDGQKWSSWYSGLHRAVKRKSFALRPFTQQFVVRVTVTQDQGKGMGRVWGTKQSTNP